jgi:hypothetical protein
VRSTGQGAYLLCLHVLSAPLQARLASPHLTFNYSSCQSALQKRLYLLAWMLLLHSGRVAFQMRVPFCAALVWQ